MSESSKRWYEKNKQKVFARTAKYKRKTFGTVSGEEFYKESVHPLVLKRDNYKCTKCGSSESLIVHHKHYDVDKLTMNDLQTLCRSCHRRLHLANKG